MQHTDQETLTLLALGEPSSAFATSHVQDCRECARELATLQRLVQEVRTARPDEPLLKQPPPDEIWAGICAELGLDPVHAGGPDHTADAAAADSTVDTSPGGASSPPVPSGRPRHAPDTAVTARPRRRLRRTMLALVACAALLGAAGGSVITWWAAADRQPSARGAVPGKSAPLDPLVPAALGSARMGNTDGGRKLDIRVEGLPPTAGYFEVWLMDREHKKLISMGVLGPDGHAVLPVPDTVDLDEYAVVDVSVQAYNGSPAHSGKSVVRGPYAG